MHNRIIEPRLNAKLNYGKNLEKNFNTPNTCETQTMLTHKIKNFCNIFMYSGGRINRNVILWLLCTMQEDEITHDAFLLIFGDGVAFPFPRTILGEWGGALPLT